MADEQQRDTLLGIAIFACAFAAVWFNVVAWLWVIGALAGLFWATCFEFADEWRQSSRKRDFRSSTPGRLNKES